MKHFIQFFVCFTLNISLERKIIKKISNEHYLFGSVSDTLEEYIRYYA